MSRHSTHEVATERLRDLLQQVKRVGQESVETLTEQAASLDRRLGRASIQADSKPAIPLDIEAFVTATRELVSSGRVSELTRTQARHAGALFLRFSPAEVVTIASTHHVAWRPFLQELFRRRMALSEVEWDAWVRVLEEAPRDLPLLDGRIPRKHLLERNAAAAAARVASHFQTCDSLTSLESTICQHGLLHRSWDFTALVMACWLGSRSHDFAACWEEIASDPVLEAMLLPRASNQRSWFETAASEALPAGIPSFELAHATVAAACFRQLNGGGFAHQGCADTALRICSASWKDPRTFSFPRESPETSGWQKLKIVSPAAYDAVVQQLLSDDLDLFFNTIKFDRDRRHYWRKKLKHIVTTSFFFSAETTAKLERTLPAATEARSRLLNALRRAKALSQAGGVDALCLTFRRGVIVEFSQTGNAAYLYSRDNYQRLQASFGNYVQISKLKNRSLGTHLLHHAGWEENFDAELARVL